ncbi:hypothetical protein GW17_00015267 [Ensete ventricosum]|nr:hypothetical protein GW17_00015267 [Ensete ventricosum]RZR91189.1 hypothetical protein BHM03_00019249 [Ensete ventricosum]
MFGCQLGHWSLYCDWGKLRLSLRRLTLAHTFRRDDTDAVPRKASSRDRGLTEQASVDIPSDRSRLGLRSTMEERHEVDLSWGGDKQEEGVSSTSIEVVSLPGPARLNKKCYDRDGG